MIAEATRRPREVAAVALAAAVAWAAVLWLVRGSTGGMSMGSTMGFGLPSFLGVWTLMMSAMMLPAVAPVASLWARSAAGSRGGTGVALFAGGYLVAWAVLGVPAFATAWLADTVAMKDASLMRWGVVAVLAGVAAYQVTPLKGLCLEHCRSPLSLLLHYAGFAGRLRDLRVGIHHALYCCGCCWPLMVLLVAVGTMNVGAMLALTALVSAEKLAPGGLVIARGAAGAAVGLALVFALSPAAFEAVVGR